MPESNVSWTENDELNLGNFYDDNLQKRLANWDKLPPTFKSRVMERPDSPSEEDIVDWDINELCQTYMEQYHHDKNPAVFKQKMDKLSLEEYRRLLYKEANGNYLKLAAIEDEMAQWR
jgi:hypothetical protein